MFMVYQKLLVVLLHYYQNKNIYIIHNHVVYLYLQAMLRLIVIQKKYYVKVEQYLWDI